MTQLQNMTQKPIPDDLKISSPMGDIVVPTESLKEVLTYFTNNIEKTDHMDANISEFFGCDVNNLEIKQKDYSGREYVMWSYSLMEIVNQEYDIIKVENFKYGDAGTPPIWNEEKINGEIFKIPYKLTMFLESKENKEPLVISFWPYDQYEIDIKFYFQSVAGVQSRYSDFWEKVKTHFNSEGLLKGAKFSADFEFLEVPEVSWEDIIIEDKTIDMLNRNIINFIPHMNMYLDKNLRSSRGVLITGPPGTGKTLCCNVVMNQLKGVTTIYVARNAIKTEGQISRLYKLARYLSPTLVIIEDIDTLGGLDRRETHDHPLLGEFLNCLSGMERNSGVITLATTNYPQHLDWALADRPGRFDSRMEFGYPKEAAREAILKKYLEPFNTGKIDLKPIIKKSEGFSGAYLQELVQTAFMLAFEAENYEVETVKIKDTHLTAALDNLLKQRQEAKKERGVVETTADYYS
jgi:AAA+ superfamily predicted ATPase